MLAEGQCIYKGNTPGLVPYLSSQGHHCPPYHNPADYGQFNSIELNLNISVSLHNCFFFFLVFFFNFGRHMSFFWGHWYPCFGFLVTSPLGLKARVGSALFAFCGGECNVFTIVLNVEYWIYLNGRLSNRIFRNVYFPVCISLNSGLQKRTSARSKTF